ncbi:hypothetical protein CLIM01_10555 [Colletotrichum limetticola]|uniref:Secreted protein n=1 Tax=Colletotrichum limetticola TaxID=1209924 RepID=A0ABQ9PJ62_9PEZI|nr:hypothetical protein CLIM01_10555 [Colletotrichum limetticola]
MGRFFFSTLLATRIVGDFMIWVFRSGPLWAILAAKNTQDIPPFRKGRSAHFGEARWKRDGQTHDEEDLTDKPDFCGPFDLANGL